MHFPPCFRFPPISEKFSDFLKFFYNFTQKISWLSSTTILLMTFFCRRPQISNFPPYFRCFNTFSPCFAKIILSSPAIKKCFPPVLGKFTCFLHALRVFFSPLLWPWCIYASPNARTGRPCLPAPTPDASHYSMGPPMRKLLVAKYNYQTQSSRFCQVQCSWT